MHMQRLAVVACAAVCAWLSLPADCCQAQVRFDFGVTSGGHYHGHHHRHCRGPGYYDFGWHYYGWSPRYWYPPPVDYVYVTPPAPRTVTVIEQSVAVPTYGATTPVASAPTPATVPAARSVAKAAAPAGAPRAVTIHNPHDSGGSVFFVVDGRDEWELRPGQARTLSGQATRQITFDRGGDYGLVERELTAGTYEFIVTDEGWELERQGNESWRTATTPVRKNTLPTTRR
jgi:hypothetical protein